MNSILNSVAAGSLLAILATAQPRYTVVDLGTLGGSYSYAYGISNAGVIAGGSATSGQSGGVSQTAFLWFNGHMTGLGTLGGPGCPDCSSEAGGPNAAGVSAVVSEMSTIDPNGEDFCGFGTHRQCLAAVWKNGRLSALPTLPGGHNSQAYWINNRGEVIGFSETGVHDTCLVPFQTLRFQAVKWGPNGEAQPLPPLSGDTVAFAFGINDRGQAVGDSGSCGSVSLPPVQPYGPHAVMWQADGSVTDLGSLPGGIGINSANAINNRGDVVGTSTLSDGTSHTFLWSNGSMRDIGSLAGDFVTVAPCCGTINNNREVAGFSCPGPFGACRAFVWRNNVIADLNTLIPAGSPWYLQQALSINDAGEIVGFGTINGEVHGFLAIPRDDKADESRSPSSAKASIGAARLFRSRRPDQ